MHYRYCTPCGVRAFAQEEQDPSGGVFYAVAIAALDDANLNELAASIKYVDGRHDQYDKTPEDTRVM